MLSFANPLAFKHSGLKGYSLTKAKETSEKIDKERNSKQKEISFGFNLAAKWDDGMSQEFGAKWAGKIKELGKTVASIEDSLDGILSSTGGGVRKLSPGKNLPVTFKILSPSIELSTNWKFAKSDKNNKVGKQVAFKLNADPIIGMEITIDLLMAAAYGINPAVGKIIRTIRDLAKEDKDIGISGDVYIDLVLSGIIKGSMEFNFNTAEDVKKFDGKIATSIFIEAKAGIYIKAKGTILVFEATLEA